MRERQGFGSCVFRTSDVGAPRTTNDKAAKRRPVIDPGICHERKNLERAKGGIRPFSAKASKRARVNPPPRQTEIEGPLPGWEGASTPPAGPAPGRRPPIEFCGQGAI